MGRFPRQGTVQMLDQDAQVEHLSSVEPAQTSVGLVRCVFAENGEEHTRAKNGATELESPRRPWARLAWNGSEGVDLGLWIGRPQAQRMGLGVGRAPLNIHACRLNGHACRFLS